MKINEFSKKLDSMERQQIEFGEINILLKVWVAEVTSVRTECEN